MYDPDHIARFFDAYGEREWDRLEADAANRASLHTHTRFLQRFIMPGMHVLEAGCGPGRFTIELARLGARVTALDISPGQLELHAERTKDVAVEARIVGDICDLERFGGGSFDAAVCFGGPLSYVIDRRDTALDELLRVTVTGGPVLLSVMSLAGAARRFANFVLDIAERHGPSVIEDLVRTGDQIRPEVEPSGHWMHLFRWSELEAFLRGHDCDILATSAANFITVQNELLFQGIRPELWEHILRLEEDLAAEPGALDAGTHIVTAVRRMKA